MLYKFTRRLEEMLNSVISYENTMVKEPACLSSKLSIYQSEWYVINFRRHIKQLWKHNFRKTTSCLLKCLITASHEIVNFNSVCEVDQLLWAGNRECENFEAFLMDPVGREMLVNSLLMAEQSKTNIFA